MVQQAEIDARYQALLEAAGMLIEAGVLLKARGKAMDRATRKWSDHDERYTAEVARWRDALCRAFGASELYRLRYPVFIEAQHGGPVSIELGIAEDGKGSIEWQL